MLSIVAVSFGVLGLSILFSFAPALLSCLFSIFKQVCICKFLKIKVLREQRAITQHYHLPSNHHCVCRQGYSGPGLRQWPQVQGSQCVTLCKSKLFFFHYSPPEYCDADGNISYFLQPVAIGADGFLCTDPVGEYKSPTWFLLSPWAVA